MIENSKKHKNTYGIYLMLILIGIQLYDAYSSELYSRVQSLYLTELLISGKGFDSEEALAYLSRLMLPCYLFIMLAPACRALADRFGRRNMLMVSVLGILIGGGICAKATSIYIFLLGNMVLNFSNSLDIHNFYIIEEMPQERQGVMRGITGGIGALAVISIPILRSIFVKNSVTGWRHLYELVMLVGIVMLILMQFVKETTAYKLLPRTFLPVRKGNLKLQEQRKKLVVDFRNIWNEKKTYLFLLFVYGIATAGITFYNEPLLSFSGLSEVMVERVLLIQPIVCCVVMLLGGRMADCFGWKRVIIVQIVLAMTGCIGLVVLRGNVQMWCVTGICYGVMLGGYWSGYHLMELSILKEVVTQRRGEGSAVITYINGIGNAIGIGLLTVFIQVVPLPIMKIGLVIPSLCLTLFLLKKVKVEGN